MTNLPDPREAMFVSERPWGSFQQFTLNEPTTVKVITVNPGQRLSLQTHEHRAEFWQVLDGPIDVTVGDETWSAQPGEQVWIAQGEVHPGQHDLVGEGLGDVLQLKHCCS